jgi:hypothetical protein
MIRFKFIVFAFLAMSAGVAHLWVLTPVLAERAVRHAVDAARPLSYAALARVEQQRAQAVQAAMVAAASPEVLAAFREPARAPEIAPEQLAAVQKALSALELSDALVGVLFGEAVTLFQNDTPVKREALSVDLKTLKEAGLGGVQAELYGKPLIVVTAAASPSPAPEGPDEWPFVVVGVPLVDSEALSRLAVGLGLRGASFAFSGKPIRAEERSPFLEAFRQGAQGGDGVPGVLETGATSSLGGLQLPFLTHKDFLGGRAPIECVVKWPVPETRLDIVAVVSTRADMELLAAYQKLVLLGLAGLLLLSLVWMFWMDSEDKVDARMAITGPISLKPLGNGKSARAVTSETLAALLNKNQETVTRKAPLEGEAFDLVNSAPEEPLSSAAPTGLRQADVESTHAYDPSFSPVTFSSAQTDLGQKPRTSNEEALSAFSFTENSRLAGQETLAYTPDPFGDEMAPPESPEHTRVATVPRELIHASAHGIEPDLVHPKKPLGALAPPVPAMALPAASTANADLEEAYYRSVFREFLALRDECGEPVDSVTYDRFAQKLRKYRDQLMQKPGVKSVRFQVYVKDGKAQVKASSVRQ